MKLIVFTRCYHLLKYKCLALLCIASIPAVECYGVPGKSSNSSDTAFHAPVFTKSNYLFSVAEDVSLNVAIGKVSATDKDSDPLMYTFKSGNTNHILSIDSSTGTITAAKRLNHHTQDSFTLVVKVSDPRGLSGEASVIVVVKATETSSDFTNISWQTAISEPYGTHEVHGEAVNGKLYVFGGYDVQKRPKFVPTKRSFVYDPAAKTWKPIADLPHNPNGPGFGGVTHEGLTTDGTDIYFAGGYPTNPAGTAQVFGTREVWRYNVALNTYTALPPLPLSLATGQLKYLKGKLHYMGGANKARNDTSVHYALDLDYLSSGWKVLAPVLNATNHPGSAVYENKIYFIGGAHHQDAKSIKQKTVEVYDPTTDKWTLKADMPVPLDHISSSVVIAGTRIIVLGGEYLPNVKSKTVLAYSPVDNTWASLTPMPSERSAGVAAFLNGALYYAGGNFSNATRKGIPLFEVDSFTLINADTEQPIQTLISGDTLNLSVLPTKNLNIVAHTSPLKVGSVQFSLTGAQNANVTESAAPYALFGDDGSGNFFAWNPPLGKYTLKATPYSSAGAKGTEGAAKTVTFTVINAAQNDTLLPQADAFVKNGNFAGTNYGSDTSLEVKSSPSAGFTRYSYLKFLLDNISSVDSATLRIYGRNISNSTGIPLSVYGVNDDAWTEKGIKYNNAPVTSTPVLSSAVVTDVAKYYEFNVTSFVKVQFEGDKTVSLLIKDSKISDKNFVFNSKEYLQNPPQLLIVTNSPHKQPADTSHLNNTLANKPGKNIAVANYNTVSQKSKVYPNPLHKTFRIEFANDYNEAYNLKIIDPVGRIYNLGKFQAKTGERNIGIDVSGLLLKPGIYFLGIYNATKQTEIIKLFVE